MSVNGDLMVVRNGRSTSQVSVYNYPEHLNPFYEDDNHKRLRFWHINKSSKDGQGRRNSFSLGGLKDMWAFKSFRLKKKSSSLGINKTSESPPPLRRELYANENGYNTYDPRMRYTTGPTNGLGGANTAFQRNVPYRSSLQDMRNGQPEQSFNGIGFNRNDRYRSTIQTAATSSSPTQTLTLPTSRRYVYRGSVTPQPVRNLEFNSDSLGKISRGSSQASVASTNPFDDEDDDDVVMGAISASSTPAKHPARKKRRAPPPPIPVHQVIKEESSSAGSTPSHKPNTPQPKKAEDNEDERLEIHNLTAEIESFVKSSNADTPEREVRSTTVVSSKTPKQNGTIPKSHPTPARETNGSLKTNNVDIVITSVEEPLFIREEQDIEKHINSPKTDEKKELKEVGHVEVIHVHVENSRSTPERSNPAPVSSFRSEVNPKSPEKILTTQTKIESININEVKQSPDKPKPPIATKPSLPKSPPPLSRLSNTRGEVVVVERPVTPEMRRREIKIEEEISSSPETPHREMPIDVGNSQTSQPQSQEVTIQVQRIVAFTEDVKEEPSIVSIPATVSPVVAPVPAVRERKHSAKEQLSPLPAARKVLVTEKEINISKKQEEPISPPVKKELKFEENNSNLEEDFPTTVSELQLIISEVEEVAARFEEHETNATGTKEILPQLVEASTATAPKAHPAPIEKPPRAKHFVEEFNENIYRPRPSQWKESTLAPLAPVPPEKRRSVKQIIDSINQNQKLLGGAKKDDENEIDSNNAQRNQSETNTNAMEQNLKSLAESQREMKRMLLELEKLENAHEQKLSNKTDENFQGILDTIVSTLAKETNKNNETDVFKKCTITKEVNNASRESSPTASNLDWNPVPKPKRTINLSPELQVKKNNNNN